MPIELSINLLADLEVMASIAALVLLYRKQQVRQFGFLAAFLCSRVLSFALYMPFLYMIRTGAVEKHLGYKIYFYVFWPMYALQTILGFGIIYSLYKLAMAPLPGLQRLGKLMFHWAGGIAIALALSLAVGPKVETTMFIQRAVHQLQQTQAILTLCMLLFVCLASKPMGLSHRSKIFGVSLGLGVLACADLVSSAWIPANAHLASMIEVMNGVAICAALAIWISYFAIPEPRRRMIILPTTSPFLRWNQISLALGDEPGYVAIGDVTPDMFAPAEVEIMRRASAKMNAMQRVDSSLQSQQMIADAV